MRVDRLERQGFDEVYRLDFDGEVAFVVLHAVLRGRTFGGIRIRSYESEDAALADACELARAMSRKSALAGLPGGGAKSVVISPSPERRTEVVRCLGEFIESLEGRYFCGGDLGFTDADHAAVSSATGYIACSGLGADSARSVLLCMRAVSNPSSVAIQGLGSIGRPLAEALVAEEVSVVASDPALADSDFDRLGVSRSSLADIYDSPSEVFAPCAVGHVLNSETIERLRCKLVCGGANNPLATKADADTLHRRGILYLPDIVANVGATIRGASTVLGEPERIEERFEALPALVQEIVERSRALDLSTYHVANRLADERIAALR